MRRFEVGLRKSIFLFLQDYPIMRKVFVLYLVKGLFITLLGISDKAVNVRP